MLLLCDLLPLRPGTCCHSLLPFRRCGRRYLCHRHSIIPDWPDLPYRSKYSTEAQSRALPVWCASCCIAATLFFMPLQSDPSQTATALLPLSGDLMCGSHRTLFCDEFPATQEQFDRSGTTLIGCSIVNRIHDREANGSCKN